MSETEKEREKLKSQLQEALSKEKIDNDQVLKLSRKLANLDPDNVRFSVDAGHINQIGKELVARQETAVSELIKNAYDADATEVELIFKNSDEEGGTLVVEDNGSGMSRDKLIDGFMRLSSPVKIHEPISPKFERTRAGRKGIGRFAAQRLGESLKIITQTEENSFALKISIDWNQFEKDRDLLLVKNQVGKLEKQKKKGTTLIINNLRDSWTEASIRQIYRYITELIQPYPLTSKLKESENDPGFQVRVFIEKENNLELVADETKMIYEHALAEIEAWVDEDGNGYWSFSSDKLDEEEKKIPIGSDENKSNSSFPSLRDVKLKVYYFIQEKEYIPRRIRGRLRELLQNRGGIRLYRNGFRVLPYGEPGNDWLNLDEVYSRRKVLPPFRNRNFIGFIEIFDVEGESFNETASREGLIENKALKELKDFAHRSLRSAAFRIASIRDKKQTAGQKDWEDKENTHERLKAVSSEIKEVADELEEKGDSEPARFVRSLAEQVDEANKIQSEKEEQYLKEIQMLRVLGSLGISIAEFTHETSQLMGSLIIDSSTLADEIENSSDLHKYASRLYENIGSLETYTSYFEKTVSANISREVKPIPLQEVVNSFWDTIKASSDRSGISYLDPEYKNSNLITVPMHESEWTSILFNFLSNSQKAIKKTQENGKIKVVCQRSEDHIFLDFLDDGIGIPDEYKDQIFDAFFTTSTLRTSNTEADELTGSGLGLKIVSDIVKSYNGNIEVIDPPDEFRTCLRVKVPAATEKQLDEYGY